MQNFKSTTVWIFVNTTADKLSKPNITENVIGNLVFKLPSFQLEGTTAAVSQACLDSLLPTSVSKLICPLKHSYQHSPQKTMKQQMGEKTNRKRLNLWLSHKFKPLCENSNPGTFLQSHKYYWCACMHDLCYQQLIQLGVIFMMPILMVRKTWSQQTKAKAFMHLHVTWMPILGFNPRYLSNSSLFTLDKHIPLIKSSKNCVL